MSVPTLEFSSASMFVDISKSRYPPMSTGTGGSQVSSGNMYETLDGIYIGATLKRSELDGGTGKNFVTMKVDGSGNEIWADYGDTAIDSSIDNSSSYTMRQHSRFSSNSIYGFDPMSIRNTQAAARQEQRMIMTDISRTVVYHLRNIQVVNTGTDSSFVYPVIKRFTTKDNVTIGSTTYATAGTELPEIPILAFDSSAGGGTNGALGKSITFATDMEFDWFGDLIIGGLTNGNFVKGAKTTQNDHMMLGS